VTWAKLSDDFPERCAEAGLSDAAVRTHIDALCKIMAREKGPVLSSRDLRRFLESEHAGRAVAELVAVGWWVREGTDGSVRVVECMADQPEPEVLAARRARDAERQRVHRLLSARLHPDTREPITATEVEAIRAERLGTQSRKSSRRDSRRESGGDPGRVGSGRERALTKRIARKLTRNGTGAAGRTRIAEETPGQAAEPPRPR
jgi:hypothetical protein